MLITSAPGKVVIAGEYAVLEGYSALSAAVNRRAYVQLTPSEHPQIEALGLDPCLIEKHDNHVVIPADKHKQLELLRLVYQECANINGSIQINSGELYHTHQTKRQKLGLGSSAAVAVALTAALTHANRDEIFQHALAAHRVYAGGKGSGIDIATCCYGGFLKFSLSEPKITPLEVKLDSQCILLVFSKQSASTTYFLQAVSNLKLREPRIYDRLMAELAESSTQLERALSENIDWKLLPQIIKNNMTTLKQLGDLAGVHIVTQTHQLIDQITRSLGGAAKPSGAGGGDIAICFIPSEHRNNLKKELEKYHLLPLEIELGAQGVQLDIL